MHPELEEILAFMDGEASPEAERHASSCPVCSAEVARVQALRGALRALPPLAPSRDLWPSTLETIGAGNTGSKWWIAAAAAILMVAAGGVGFLLNGGQEGKPGTTVQPVQQATAGPGSPDPVAPWDEPPLPSSDPEVARLIRNSQRLEFLLDHLDEGPVVVSGRKALAEMGIEERLSFVDARLEIIPAGDSGREERVGLWQERVKLLGTLAQVKGGMKRTAEI